MKNYFFVELITVSAIVAVGALLAMLGGCDEAKMMNPVMDEVMGPEKGTTPKTAGEMKKEEETPVGVVEEDTAKEPKDITPPVVTEVQYYRDRQLTELVTEAVHPGDTIYTKVVFSEPVRQVIADDNTSRPALFVVIDGRAVRYRTKKREKDLESGDCRSMNGTDVYLCRYTVPEETSGTVALRVGGATADEAGNWVTESSSYTASFVVEEPRDIVAPEVTEISYYHDQQLTELVTEAVHPGDTIFTKVVFSELAEHIIADDGTARPALFMTTNGKEVRYRMRAVNSELENGDCRPLDGTAYLCRYAVPENTFGTITLKVGRSTTDTAGNAVIELSYTEPITVEPEPAIVLPDGYTLPAYLIPQEETVLSDNEMALIEADRWVKAEHPDFDPFRPTLQTQAGHAADLISLLPYKDREEVYNLFIASVNLPHFAEAAKVMKEINLTLKILGGESYMTGNQKPYNDFLNQSYRERRLIPINKIADVYFEENPQDAPYRSGYSHSFYWIFLEWYRLQLVHPHLRDGVTEGEFLRFFRESARNGYVFGLDNPWG